MLTFDIQSWDWRVIIFGGIVTFFSGPFFTILFGLMNAKRQSKLAAATADVTRETILNEGFNSLAKSQQVYVNNLKADRDSLQEKFSKIDADYIKLQKILIEATAYIIDLKRNLDEAREEADKLSKKLNQGPIEWEKLPDIDF